MRPLLLSAMENTLYGIPEWSWPERCFHIAASGFQGIYAVPYPLKEEDLIRLRTLSEEPRRHGLTLVGLYTNRDLALDGHHPDAERVLRLFHEVEEGTTVEISFKSSQPYDPTTVDDSILRLLETYLFWAEKRNLHLSLYPHSFYPLEKMEHASLLVRRLQHPRLSSLFPLSHIYSMNDSLSVVEQLKASVKEIKGFNACGCRKTNPSAREKCTHHALDESDLDFLPLWKILIEGGYTGPIVIQGHGWQGDPLASLRQSAKMIRALESLSDNQ